MHFNFGQKIIDIIRGKKVVNITTRYKDKKTILVEVNKISELEEDKIKYLRQKLKNGDKIKVAFLQMYATSIQNLSIYEKMLNSEIFEPYFIVNPDISRSKNNFDFNYKRTKIELSNKYGNERVLDGYDFGKNIYIDYTSKFDIATTNNPYDSMAHEFFKISYWSKKSIPMFYIPYFFMGRCHVTIHNLKLPEFNFLWKIFVENENTLNLAKKYEIIKGDNIVVSGCPKLDELSHVKHKYNSQQKKIIIAPHHSIDNRNTSVGGFLEYADVLQKLPIRYPNIDFVFRPHPLLFETIENKGIWSSDKIKSYISQLLENKNVIYDTSGSYFELFVNSDVLIHDCGSFSAEYLCTGHPAAYYIKDTLNFDSTFTDFGKKCIDLHYQLKNEDDFYNFIDNVVIAGNDLKKDDRIEFAKDNILINHPNSTEYIINYIKNVLT